MDHHVCADTYTFRISNPRKSSVASARQSVLAEDGVKPGYRGVPRSVFHHLQRHSGWSFQATIKGGNWVSRPLRWPEVDTARAYRLSSLRHESRPAAWDPTVDVASVTPEQARRPRPCIGSPAELAGLEQDPVFWCRSCNRRVAHGKQPFCQRHQQQRAQYTRDLRRALAQPVRVPRTTVSGLHTVSQLLATYSQQHRDAETDPQKDTALSLLLEAVDTFAEQVRRELPSAEVHIQRRPLRDPETR